MRQVNARRRKCLRGTDCPRQRSNAGECGAVTAELAVGFPAVVLLLVTILTLAAASGAQMRALDAARAGARAVAVGQSDAQVGKAVEQLAGSTARWQSAREGEWVRIDVWKPVVGGPLVRGPLQAHGRAYAWVEPTRAG